VHGSEAGVSEVLPLLYLHGLSRSTAKTVRCACRRGLASSLDRSPRQAAACGQGHIAASGAEARRREYES
jgi:hypothetical protein